MMPTLVANHMPALAFVVLFGPWTALVVWLIYLERRSARKAKARQR